MRSFRSFVLMVMVAASLMAAPTVPASTAARIEPGLFDRPGPVEVLARFDRTVPPTLLEGHLSDVTILYRFRATPAVFARAADLAALRALAALPGLAYLEADKPVEMDLDSATTASRAREVWAPSLGEPLRDGDGRVIDGTGVGIAVVDSGLDALHPDFQVPGKVGGDYLVTPGGPIPVPSSSSVNSGHGTHVAGIALGTGEASGGQYRGVASGATLYSFNIFGVVNGTVALSAIAFDWILQHGDEQQPPIRVVNNSWHCSVHTCRNAFNPDGLHLHLASEMAEAGITVTWSAGNEGGDGTVAVTNPEAYNPTPGIIGVANYKDERSTFETGVRDNRVSGTSSRGDSRDPSTWPDVSAPGRHVISTWATHARMSGTQYAGRNPLTGENAYYLQDGTSMAAPHVAGIAALLLQAKPDLTPAEIEYIIKRTSDELPNEIGYVRADASHPWNGANYEDGHGLVDALAAVTMAQTFAGIPAAPDPEAIPTSFLVSTPGIAVDTTMYLTDGDGISATPPAQNAVAHKDINEVHVYTSAPFTTAKTMDAVSADLFIATAHEYVADTHAHLQFLVTVERVDALGARTALGQGTEYSWHTVPGVPNDRRFQIFFGQPETIEAGERLGLRILLEKTPGTPPATVGDKTLIVGGTAVWTGRPTLSRLGLGTRVDHPAAGSDMACRARYDCAVVGGEAEESSMTCGMESTRLRWHGPAGSALHFDCDGFTAVCQVPGLPGDPEGDCELVVDPVSRPDPVRDGRCRYVTPDGALGGSGRCEVLRYLEGRN